MRRSENKVFFSSIIKRHNQEPTRNDDGSCSRSAGRASAGCARRPATASRTKTEPSGVASPKTHALRARALRPSRGRAPRNRVLPPRALAESVRPNNGRNARNPPRVLRRNSSVRRAQCRTAIRPIQPPRQSVRCRAFPIAETARRSSEPTGDRNPVVARTDSPAAHPPLSESGRLAPRNG